MCRLTFGGRTLKGPQIKEKPKIFVNYYLRYFIRNLGFEGQDMEFELFLQPLGIGELSCCEKVLDHHIFQRFFCCFCARKMFYSVCAIIFVTW